MIYKGKGGIEYNLNSSPFAQGGEGMIFDILGKPNLVAKLYKNGLNNIEKEKKLIAMVDNPPDKNVMDQISWPVDVLYDYNKTFVGFIMHKLKINEELNVIYEYGDSAKYPDTPWSSKIVIAKNLCVVLNAVHEAGHVVGDLNPKNISVDPSTGHVIFVDTDSYHIEDSGVVYRCNVGMPEYLPVEIQNKMKGGLSSCPLPTFSEHTDNFALAVHIFQLLMNSCHPFSCRVLPSQASVAFPQPTDNILNGVFPFMQPKAGTAIPIFAPGIDVLPKEIQEMFKRAFIEGHTNPSRRPNPVEWHTALTKLEKELVKCKKIGHHVYYKKLNNCPWCEVDAKFGKGVSTSSSMPIVQSTIKQGMKPAYQTKTINPINAPTPNIKSNKPKRQKRHGSVSVLSIILLTFSALLLAFDVLLLKNPQIIFTYIHYGWILGFGIGFFILLLVLGIILAVRGSNLKVCISQIVVACGILALMIFGLTCAYKTTYKLSIASDFQILNNLPENDKHAYHVELTNDIDFEGEKVAETYGNGSAFIFDGKGYSLKNIDYNVKVNDYSQYFFKFTYSTTVKSKIKNLSIVNSEFHITPNHYYERSHEGAECDFYLFSKSALLENVNLSITIFAHKAEDNIKYSTPSKFDEIYPTSQTENGCNFNIKLIKED